jgi:hypothetical protein
VAYYLFNFTKSGADKARPLREQAAVLLSARLWGIGDKTANRDLLAAGDRVLAYTGAPEKAFVGHATLSSDVHDWTEDERGRYPEGWPAGVAFSDAVVWDKPVPLAAVWSEMPSSTTNPNGQFFGGVIRIKREDFERVLLERGETTIERPKKPLDATVASRRTTMLDRLFEESDRLRTFLANPKPLSEDATRAVFINKYLDALGYTEIGDVDYGVHVDSGDVADYVLQPGGQRAMVVEAKKLGAPLGAKEAAQVVKYASVLGLRWGAVTDGQHLKIYDAPVPNVPPEERLVLELDLAGFADREDFEVAIYPDLALLSKNNVGSGTRLEERAAQTGIRELVTSAGSKTLAALQEELKNKKKTDLTNEQLADLLAGLLG